MGAASCRHASRRVPVGGRATLVLGLAVVAAAGSCGKRSRPLAADRASSAAPTDPDRAFWAWFVDHSATLTKTQDLIDVMNEVQRELDKAHKGIIAEVGLAGSDRLLVLSADGDRSVFPAVQHLFAARPKVNGWKIVAFRPRDTHRPMLALEMDGHKLDPEAVRYVATRDDGKLDLQLYVPGYQEGDNTSGMMAFLALDHSIGEYDTETRIGSIDFLPLEQAPARAHPLDDLPGQIDALGSAQAR